MHRHRVKPREGLGASRVAFVPAERDRNAVLGIDREEWQSDAWAYWHALGELHYPTDLVAKQLTRVNWDVQLPNGDFVENPEDYYDDAAEGIGISQMSYYVGLHFMVAGAGYIIEEDDGFHVYSVITPKVTEKRDEALRQNRVAIKFLNPDPVDPTRADSSIRSALAPAEQLLTLQALDMAQNYSRISQAGILWIPSGALDEYDTFGEDLITKAGIAINDPRSPASYLPIMAEMDPDDIEKISHMTFDRPFDERIDDKIKFASSRIALALDMPPELLQGITVATNHWGSWVVLETLYTSHVTPLADLVGDTLTEVANAKRAKLGLEKIRFVPNFTELMARRSSVRDALDMLAAGVVSFEYVREAAGVSDEYIPSDEELELIQKLFGKGATTSNGALVEENPGPPASDPQVQE